MGDTGYLNYTIRKARGLSDELMKCNIVAQSIANGRFVNYTDDQARAIVDRYVNATKGISIK